MQRFLSHALLTLAAVALSACTAGTDPSVSSEGTTDVPDESHVRIENPEALTYTLNLGHVDGVRTYGARIVVEGATISSFERNDAALKSAGGQVLPALGTSHRAHPRYRCGHHRPGGYR